MEKLRTHRKEYIANNKKIIIDFAYGDFRETPLKYGILEIKLNSRRGLTTEEETNEAIEELKFLRKYYTRPVAFVEE